LVKAAITGGLACGKSTVLAMFAALPHVATLSADEVVHQLYEPGEPVYRQVVAAFGRGILDADQRIDRRKLADAAFRGPERRRQLESIVHPAVIDYEIAWLRGVADAEAETRLAVIEVPLLFEAKSEGKFEKVIAVVCAPEIRLARFRERHPELAEADARRELERRSASQLPEAEKQRRADLVIDNSGSLAATRAQVEKIYQELARPVDGHAVGASG
jgi:dephospho-CoA kinase